MKKHSICSRIVSLLLAVVMLLSMVPAIDVSAAPIGEDGYLGNIKLLNNGESITLPIKVNNFAMDGLMFEYLTGTHDDRNSQFYQYEPGGTYQLFTLHLAGKKVGVDAAGNHVSSISEPDDDAMEGVNTEYSLTGVTVDGDLNLSGYASDETEHQSTLRDYDKEDGGGTKFLRLVVSDRDNTANSDRAWRKLTRFAETKTIDQSRYAVIIYRVNGDTQYDNMLLTWNYCDEVSSGENQNCSQTVPVAKNTTGATDPQWQYAIIDLAYELGSTEEERAAAATGITIEDIYLKSPLKYDADTGKSIDLAAVAYFPYYGDAEQFVHYGLTLGCIQKYYERDNRAFNFREDSIGYSSNNYSVETWNDKYSSKYGNQIYITGSTGVTLQADSSTEGTIINSVEELSYALFGETTGYASLGLLESQLGENGRPVYKEVVVDFLAFYLQKHLTAIPEYPSAAHGENNNNYGWKNYNYMTGVSTTSGVDEARFGKDALGHSIDLATALCNCVDGAIKGGGLAYTGELGTYAETRAKANELVGTWDECKDNIDTWSDAAYYLLHNLFVTDGDAAYDGDGYGEYENDYQNMVLPQFDYKDAAGNVKKAYAFDSSFCIDGHQYHSAVVYDGDKHILGMDPAMDETSGMLPFLPVSGNGTEEGESNTPYYADQATNGVYGRKDYHFTISGNGFFQYERDLFFDFKGDDDVYLFINGQLVMDIGGTHNATESKIKVDDYVDWAWAVKNGTSQYKGLDYAQLPSADRARIDALALEEGEVYSFDFFYMERHGAGSTLRIVTNMEVTAEGLNVDKTAYQNGIEVAENGIVDLEKPIEYGFKITNDSENNLKRLTFQDSVIGVSIDYENGLQISEECKSLVRNESGNPLTVADLEILVSGKDTEDIVITCYDNEELKAFLEDLTSNDGTLSGDGLWADSSIQIRGIYYTMTAAQKAVGSFRNYVAATANSDGIILRGADDHTVYQAGNLAYYHWVGNPVVIERARFYKDVLEYAVDDADDLPALGNMILVPSDVNGIERQDDGIVNTRGGDVYLKLNYTVPGTYIAYVTIRDQTDASYSRTVPVTIYATDAKDSAMVLDYGLDSYLTDNKAIFDNELNLAVGENVTGTVMGIAAEGITPSYKEYDTGSLETVIGNTENKLALVSGSYADTKFTNARFQLDTPIYLEHTKPWVIEFEVSNLNSSSCLFSLEPLKETDGNLQLNLYKSGVDGFITLGTYSSTDSRTNDYGVKSSLLTKSNMTHIKLYNVPAGDGTNMVYCSVNGNTGVAMTNVYHDGAPQNSTSTGISGKDFTFTYIGCYRNSPSYYDYGLDLKMNYLYVYQEDEKQLTHYRWKVNGTDYDCEDTQKTGYEANGATHSTYTYDNLERNRWKLNNNVVLNSDRAWEIEFAMQPTSTSPNLMLFTSTESETNGKTSYINIVPGKRLISMGSVVGGKYVGYAAVLPSNFVMTEHHTYLLKNRINADGTNMVYLYVDKDEKGVWSEVGPLHYYSEDSSIGVVSTGLSGMNFSFGYIGGYDDWGVTDHGISYIEVHEDTALRTAYQWTAGTDQFTNVYATSDDGNCIEFTKEESGVVTVDSGTFTLDGTGLKFETSDFMDQAYTTYVALTIHDSDYTPTPLDQSGINVAKEVQMYKKVSVIPANVVYYEDDFPAIHYVTGNKNAITSIGTETLDKLQSADQDTEYGSDPFYENDSSDMSGDHIYKIDIREDDSSLAWFEFKGTGFELISTTNADNSAMICVEVYKKGDVTIANSKVSVNADALKVIPVIPEFDHQDNDGEEVIHQVPLLRWQREDDIETPDVDEALEAGEYVVTINAYATYDYSQGYENAPMIPTYLYIDGIRIFQPMGYDVDGYNDVENKMLFDEVRDYIIDGKIYACEKDDDGLTSSTGTVTWTENHTGLDYTGTYFVGNKVNNVNDYLLKGPNNEVYMDGTSTESSLAFVVYRDEEHKNSDLQLQIGVRAIDVGNFYGAGTSGMKANLQIGVTDANGSNSWMHLATVTSGTEQYITVPYELCPVEINNGTVEYHVVIRVAAFTESIPAMVSFTSLKHTEGLELKEGIGEALTIYQDENGQWVTSRGEIQGISNFMLVRRAMMAETVITNSDAVRGENFVNDTVVPESEPAILPKYPALSFEEEVQYHVFYTVQNLGDVALDDMGLITFDTENLSGTISDAMDVIPGAVINGDQYVVHTNGIQAKKLGDTLYFKVYAKLADGSYVYSDMYNYSAKVYAMNQLKGTNDSVKPLVVAMLNYGAAAQQFFGYRTDSLMNAELTADQQALVQKYDSNMATAVVPADSNKVGTFVSNSGFTRMRPSVTFGGAFSINYFFTPAYALDGDITMYYWDAKTYNSVDELTVENALGSKKMVTVEGGEYFAAYTDIAAKEIGDTVYVAAVYESNGQTYCTGVLPYSLSLYCKRFAENTASDAQDLAAATLVYGYYAECFFGA